MCLSHLIHSDALNPDPNRKRRNSGFLPGIQDFPGSQTLGHSVFYLIANSRNQILLKYET